MKEFLKTNTVTYNLLSFTGFKTILLFSLLMEGPKSYNEIQKVFLEHEYLKEQVSIDSLRVYFNSLKASGCKINKTRIDGVTKYYITSHPFVLNVSEAQAKSIIKVYKAISKSIDVEDLIMLQQFTLKISQYVSNENLKNRLQRLSPLNEINPEILNELKHHAHNNDEITILYNSLNTNKKRITILVDKLTITNGKLYVCGYNSEYQNYSSFLVSRILQILSVNIKRRIIETPYIVSGYELVKTKDDNFVLQENEKIIKEDETKYLIEITSRNKFDIIQRIMSHTNKSKVLYPENIRAEIISNLKHMKEGYLEG